MHVLHLKNLMELFEVVSLVIKCMRTVRLNFSHRSKLMNESKEMLLSSSAAAFTRVESGPIPRRLLIARILKDTIK